MKYLKASIDAAARLVVVLERNRFGAMCVVLVLVLLALIAALANYFTRALLSQG